MKRLFDNITYIIGFILVGLIIYELVNMLLNLNTGRVLSYVPDIICYIGGLAFVLSCILGIYPVSGAKKELFDEILEFLFESEERKEEKYKIPAEIMSRLKKDKRDEEALYLLAKDIVSFCDVDSTDLSIKIQQDLVEAAGTYNSETNEINISIAHTRTLDEELAVVIHECMHYILREKRLWLESREKNEFLTDIATLYFGFDEYINRGYILVGYLKRNEIRYIKKMIREYPLYEEDETDEE